MVFIIKKVLKTKSPSRVELIYSIWYLNTLGNHLSCDYVNLSSSKLMILGISGTIHIVTNRVHSESIISIREKEQPHSKNISKKRLGFGISDESTFAYG